MNVTQLQQHMAKLSTLALEDFSKPLILEFDTSFVAIGAVPS